MSQAQRCQQHDQVLSRDHLARARGLLKRITGSWHALFFLTAGFHALSALVYGVWAQVEPAPVFREKQD